MAPFNIHYDIRGKCSRTVQCCVAIRIHTDDRVDRIINYGIKITGNGQRQRLLRGTLPLGSHFQCINAWSRPSETMCCDHRRIQQGGRAQLRARPEIRNASYVSSMTMSERTRLCIQNKSPVEDHSNLSYKVELNKFLVSKHVLCPPSILVRTI